MKTLEFVEMAISQSRNATLALVSGLDRDQLMWRAGPEANTVGFLVWHVFRTEDRYIRFLTGEEETYTADGWKDRWPLPDTITGDRAALTTGNSWTSDEVGAFDIPPIEELLAYGEAVRGRVLELVAGTRRGHAGPGTQPRAARVDDGDLSPFHDHPRIRAPAADGLHRGAAEGIGSGLAHAHAA